MKRLNRNRRLRQSRSRSRGRYLTVVPLLLAGVALAVEPAGKALATAPQGGTPGWLGATLRLALATAAVMALAWGSIWALKKLITARAGGLRSDWITVVATSYIAPKKQVSLVRVLDRFLVVGVTESGISTLAELDGETVSKHLETSPSGSTDRSPFSKMFRDVLSTGAGSTIR